MKNRNFVEGISILAKYLDGEDYDISAEHDQIHVGMGRNPENMTVLSEDYEKLKDLGWFIDSTYGDWSCFV